MKNLACVIFMAPLQRCFESAAGSFGPAAWLCLDAEQAVDEAGLRPAPDGIEPEVERALFEHTHYLKALEGGLGRSHRLKAEEGRLNQALQLAVIGFEAIIQEFHWPGWSCFERFSALAKSRLAALVSQVADR